MHLAPCTLHEHVVTGTCTLHGTLHLAPCTLHAPPNSFIIPLVPIGSAFHERTASCRELELPRLGRLLRRQRLRRAPLLRIQRDPERVCRDLHLAAVQVPASRFPVPPGWSTASSPATPRACKLARSGVHAVVRRGGHGHRRWHGDPPGRGRVPVDRGASEPALAGRERRRPRRSDRRHLRAGGGPGAAGADLARAPRDGVRRADRSPKDFRATRTEIAGVPVDVSRTGYTGDLRLRGSGCRGTGRAAVWDRARSHVGKALTTGTPAGMLALDVARVEAGLLLIDVDFHGSAEGARRRPDATRPAELGTGASRRPAEARRSSAAGRSSRNNAADIGGRLWAWSSSGPRSRPCTRPVGLPPGRGRSDLARGGAGLQRPDPDRPRDVHDLVDDARRR